MSKTEKNLWEAFAGESQANRKYLAFAKQAEKEGKHRIAKLFRATAEAETVHALTHFKTLGEIKDTAANLKAAIAGETHEFTKMYPAMIDEAHAEDHAQAIRTFRYANEVEKVHAELYQKALAEIDDPREADYYVCSVCGHTVEDHAPDKCPVCGAAGKAYTKIA